MVKKTEENQADWLVPEDEQPYEVPDNWNWVKLGSVSHINMGQSPEGEYTNLERIGLPLIGGPADMGEFFPNTSRYTSKPSKTIKEGALIVTIRATLGKLNFSDKEYCIGRGVAAVTSSKANLKFIGYYIKTQVEYFYSISSGTTFAQISKDDLVNLRFPLPPLSEQKRIVDKLESMLGKINEARELIEQVQETFKERRAAILTKIISGELTEKWRIENSNPEFGLNLLERIKLEKEQHQSNKNIVKKTKINAQDIDINSLPTLPSNWVWAKLVDIAEIKGGVTKGRDLENKETIMIPYLRVANVQDDYLDLSEIKEIKVLPEDQGKYRLIHGDILFTEGGDRDKLGRGTIWRNQIENCIHQNHIFRARLYLKEMLPEFISFVTSTIYAKDYFFKNATQSVNLASINLTTLGNLPMPIPPLEEQKEIFRIVEHLLSLENEAKELVDSMEEQLNLLEKSILSKAFRGELGTNNPEENSPLTPFTLNQAVFMSA
jgi:type I restriction enzyme S subunit